MNQRDYDDLVSRGFTGSLNDMRFLSLSDLEGSTNDKLLIKTGELVTPEALNDNLRSYSVSLGGVGSINDALTYTGIYSSFAGPEGYRAFELQIELWAHEGGPVGTTGYTRVSELQILVDTTKYPTVNMTGLSTPSPLVASATTSLGGMPAWYAFDGTVSDGTRWMSNGSGTQKLRIDLGEGAAISPTSIKIAPDSGAPNSRICKFKFVGSSTGAFSGEEEILLDVDLGTAIDQWSPLTLKTFNI